MTNKVLFILKRRPDYNSGVHTHVGLSTGLYNSASFMNTMLNDAGIESNLEVAIDNNCIDRLVTKHRPTHVVIEAIWVTPIKLQILKKLHPNVIWVIRVHSELPFLAGESIALDWIADYSVIDKVVLAINAPRMMHEIEVYLKTKTPNVNMDDKIIYLPNYYPQDYKSPKKLDKKKDTIDIACFGAVRPLKNHLVQAIASIDFANKLGKKLRFHINAGRIEMNGGPVINNLKSVFEQLSDSGHQLINHQWTPREQFLELCSKMDIGLQVSFSETFNIVGADLVSQGVPLVGSDEIPWKVPAFAASPTESEEMVEKLRLAYTHTWLNVKSNQWALTRYTNKTEKIWTKYFSKE